MSYLDNLSEVRAKIDSMTDRIVCRLADRSQYLQNGSIYRPDAIKIKNRKGISLLEFALEGLEKYHASLGRYSYPDQFSILGKVRLQDQVVSREIPQTKIPKMKIEMKDEIIRFYKSSLKDFCRAGEAASTFGETAYIDADLILLLNERINLGRFVAHHKLKENPSLREIQNTKKLLEKLRSPEREREVIKKFFKAADKYDFDSRVSEKYVRWIIEKTTEVEIFYIRNSDTSR